MKPFLILQLRPEDIAADDEFRAILKYGGLSKQDVVRIRMEREDVPLNGLDHYSGIIIGGGPSNVSDPEDQKPAFQKRFEADLDVLLFEIYRRDFPFLGSCYGFGKLIQNRCGVISKEKYTEEVGFTSIRRNAAGDPLTEGLPKDFLAFGGHKEACQELPEGAVVLGSSVQCPYQMIRLKNNIYATQFHVELDEEGLKVRIQAYKNYGYFPPETAEELIRKNSNVPVTVPMKILRRFVEKYQTV